jgi:uncharacterized protein (DUF1330 family)
MTAYVIYHQTEISDPDLYQEYIGHAREVVAKYGGRHIVGGAFEVLRLSNPACDQAPISTGWSSSSAIPRASA